MTQIEAHVTYPYLKYRQRVWREIVRFVAKDLPPVDTVVEFGPGYCDFINQFPAKRKIAFEINPKMKPYAGTDVDFRLDGAMGIKKIDNKSIDLVFASNFLEHLEQSELDNFLPEVARCLKPNGRMILIQPNYTLCAKKYFDDPTHKLIMSDKNLAAFLKPHGLAVVKLRPRFLPFSMKTRLPKWPILIRLYLMLPVKPFGAQMYAIVKGA